MLVKDTIDGLQDLLGLLTCVDEKGWKEGFSEIIMRGRERSGNSHSYTEPLLSLRQALDNAKAAMATLNGVKKNLAWEIRSLRRRSAPLVLEDGIKRLPDELLAHIFKMGHKEGRFCNFCIHVSHVSCRFRQVALRTPHLWTEVSRDYPPEKTQVYIARTGHLDLKVSDPLRENIPSTFWDFVVPLSSRWSTLDITSNVTKDMMRSLGLTNFPRLRHIRYRRSLEPDLSSWYIPLLSSIETDGLPVTPLNLVSLRSQLTHLTLRFTDYSRIGDSDGIVDVTALSQTLISLRTLQNLSLSLSGCRAATGADQLDSAKLPKPHSVNIDTLAILITGQPEYSLVSEIYDALSFYTSTTVCVTLGVDNTIGNFPERFLYTSGHVFFPYGSTIHIRHDLHCGISELLREMSKHCKIVRSVHLELPSAHASYMVKPLYGIILPSSLLVHHLHLRNCDSLDETAIGELAKALLSSEGNKRVEALEFITCKQISEEFLLDLQDELGPGLTWVL